MVSSLHLNIHDTKPLIAATGHRLTFFVTVCFLILTCIIPVFNRKFHNRAPISVPSNKTKSGPNKPPNLPQCPHTLLFTGPRHGSTWFINSIERCKYTTHNPEGKLSFKSTVNKNSELWIRAQSGPVRDIAPEAAAQYILHNNSIKAFPPCLLMHYDKMYRLLQQVKLHKIPIILLTRDLAASYESLQIANKTGIWANQPQKISSLPNPKQSNLYKFRESAPFLQYEKRMNNHYKHVRQLVRQLGISNFDEFDYDLIREERYIIASNIHCYVRNCNFDD